MLISRRDQWVEILKTAEAEGLTRAEVADKYGVSKATVTYNLAKLKESGITVNLPYNKYPGYDWKKILSEAIENGETAQEIAKRIGAHDVTVRKAVARLKKEGFAVKNNRRVYGFSVHGFDWEKVLNEAAKSGETYSQLANRLGVKVKTIKTAASTLRKRGKSIPFRNQKAGKASMKSTKILQKSKEHVLLSDKDTATDRETAKCYVANFSSLVKKRMSVVDWYPIMMDAQSNGLTIGEVADDQKVSKNAAKSALNRINNVLVMNGKEPIRLSKSYKGRVPFGPKTCAIIRCYMTEGKTPRQIANEYKCAVTALLKALASCGFENVKADEPALHFQGQKGGAF